MLISKHWKVLFWIVPVAACGGGVDGDDGSGDVGGSSPGGTGGSTSGTGPQGGAGPSGGTAGAQGGTAGAGPSGGSAGVASGGAAGVGVGGTVTGGAAGSAQTGGVAGISGTAGVGGAGTSSGGAGGSTAGKGGTAGSAGAVSCTPTGTNCSGCGVVCCPTGAGCAASPATGILGWATQGGTTTGGGSGAAMTVTTASALSTALAGSTARVVSFSGTLSVSSLTIGSNKTLVGANATATINGGISLDGVSNVILRNFRLNAASSGVGDDGIGMQNSNHVWIDHLEIYDAPDGNMDITDGSDYITVSWTKFRYTNASGTHNFSNLIAGDDGDTGNYRITFHHNWWANNVKERMPRVRHGDVHVVNNYFSATGNDHCVRAAFQSSVRVQNNYFDSVRTPHEIDEDSGTGVLTPTGNVYCLSLHGDTTPQLRGTAFTPPYTYAVEPAECIKTNVMANAGPR